MNEQARLRNPRLRRVLFALPLAGALLASGATAQEGGRGLGAGPSRDQGTGTWRAVVVGVSDYSVMGSLQFADNDAEALHDYLVSPHGGGLAPENVVLLVGRHATRPAIGEAIHRLAAATGPNDGLIFYFAGHGDVQRVRDEVPGDAYLLLSNATRGAYAFSNDAIRPRDVQEQVELLMGTNGGGNFIIILDACRSGQVADTEAGARAALQRLGQWQGVNKLLSSTGDQLSYESAQFGGGHGVFTYYLLEALHGMAETDADGLLTFRAVERYVADRVEAATDTLPFQRQTPVAFAANPRLPLFAVSDESRNRVAAMRASGIATLALRDRSDGGALSVPAFVNDSVAALLREFDAALREGRLLDESGAGVGPETAWALERLLADVIGPDPDTHHADLLLRVRGTLAVALQESAHEPLRRFIRGVSDIAAPARFRTAAHELAHARTLLGAGHPLREEIADQERFLEAFAIIRERDVSRFGEAQALLTQALERRPDGAPLHAALATLEDARGDYAAAHHHVDRALELAPRWEYAHKLKADILSHEGRYEEALRTYNHLLELHPASSVAFNNRGVLYVDLDRYADARHDFEAALALSGSAFHRVNLAAVALDQGRLAEADSLLARALEQEPGLAHAHRLRGNLLVERREGELAEQAFRRAIELDPFDGRNHVGLGDLLFETDPDAAELAFREAIRADPLYDYAYARLARLLHGADPAAAERVLVDAEAALPRHAGIAYRLGEFHLAEHEHDEADRWLALAIERGPLHYWARIELAQLRHEQGRYAESDAIVEEAVSLFAGNPLPSLWQGTFRYVRGDLAGAARSYGRALEVDSLNVRARASLAEVRADQGLIEAAVALYGEVSRADPWRYGMDELAARFATRAAALEAGADDESALRVWRAAMALAPDDPIPPVELGRLLYRRGAAREARSLLEPALPRTADGSATDRAYALGILALVMLDLGEPGEALRLLDEADGLRPVPDASSRAIALLAVGRTDEARVAFRASTGPSAITLSPRARALLERLQREEARP